MKAMFNPNTLSTQVDAKERAKPPVHLWNPELNGDLDMQITADGRWIHEGDAITRIPLVKLFSSILKREGDDYFLVTPVEKWRISVERQPFCLNLCEAIDIDGVTWLEFSDQFGERVRLDDDHPLWFVDVEGQSIPCISVRSGLNASLSRSVYYELANLAQDSNGEMMVFSGGKGYSLGSIY